MPAYFLFLLCPDGHARRRLTLQCDSDDEAMAHVDLYTPHCGVELWLGERMIAKVERPEG